MSIYSNFIQDYPERCSIVLSEHYDLARSQGFEVTLMLAMASTGLIVPFERLRKPHDDNSRHPSEDRGKFVLAAESFNDLLKKPFWGSTLWPRSTGSWCRGRLSLETVKEYPGEPEHWPEFIAAKSVKRCILLESVLFNIRNALAHGNVFVGADYSQLQKGNERPIATIIFLKENREKENGEMVRKNYTFLSCSPEDFRRFLVAWFIFLKALNMPRDVIPESNTYSTDHEQIATA